MRFSNALEMDPIEPMDGKQIRCITTVKTVSCVQRATAIAIAVTAEVVLARATAPVQFMVSRARKKNRTIFHRIKSIKLSCLI